MTFVAHLWLPILLSASLVFVLSAASHMLLPWRRGEWGRLTDAAALQSALRGLPPGQYTFPAAPSPRDQMTPEWLARFGLVMAGLFGWLWPR